MLLAIVLAAACKERGTATIDVTIPDALHACFGDANTVLIYAVPNRSCSECTCGGCFAGNVVACGGNPCPLDGQDIPLNLPAGRAALVYDFFRDAQLVASACVEIALDKDGTDNVTFASIDDDVVCCEH